MGDETERLALLCEIRDVHKKLGGATGARVLPSAVWWHVKESIEVFVYVVFARL